MFKIPIKKFRKFQLFTVRVSMLPTIYFVLLLCFYWDLNSFFSTSSFIPDREDFWRISGSKWIFFTICPLPDIFFCIAWYKIDLINESHSLSQIIVSFADPFDTLDGIIPFPTRTQYPKVLCFSFTAVELGAVWFQQISVSFVQLFQFVNLTNFVFSQEL